MQRISAIIDQTWIAALLVCFFLVSAGSANLPPVIQINPDSLSVSTGETAFLVSDVSDDSTPVDQLEILWTQIDGPGPAELVVPESQSTMVFFSQVGRYRFVLSASDGSLTSRDTLIVTVRQSLPFVILHPANNEEIEIGKPYVIRWQMDPSLACNVSVEINGTSEGLTHGGASRDSLVWYVGSQYTHGTVGVIQVWEYQNEPNHATQGGTFVLVNRSQPAINPRHATSGRFSTRLTIDKSGFIRVRGDHDGPATTVTIADLQGRTLLRAPLTSGVIGHLPINAGRRTMPSTVVYRLSGASGTLQDGILRIER